MYIIKINVYKKNSMHFVHELGQLCEIAEDMFHLKLNVNVVKESMEGNYYVAVLRLEFDNSDYVSMQVAWCRDLRTSLTASR